MIDESTTIDVIGIVLEYTMPVLQHRKSILGCYHETWKEEDILTMEVTKSMELSVNPSATLSEKVSP